MSSGPFYRSYSFNALWALVFKFPLFAYFVGFVEDFVISIIKTGPIPKHVAMIMDGKANDYLAISAAFIGNIS